MAEILKILLRNEQLSDDVDIASLSQKTETFSGSDLKRKCCSVLARNEFIVSVL